MIWGHGRLERGGEATGVRRGGAILCYHCVGGGDLATSGKIAHTYEEYKFWGTVCPLIPKE